MDKRGHKRKRCTWTNTAVKTFPVSRWCSHYLLINHAAPQGANSRTKFPFTVYVCREEKNVFMTAALKDQDQRDRKVKSSMTIQGDSKSEWKDRQTVGYNRGINTCEVMREDRRKNRQGPREKTCVLSVENGSSAGKDLQSNFFQT